MTMPELDKLYFIARADTVEAGAPLAVLGRAAPKYFGLYLEITDHADAVIGRHALGNSINDIVQTEELALAAPDTIGSYVWTARLVADPDDAHKLPAEPLTAQLSVVVVPIKTTLMAWDVPSTAEIGAAFAFKVGLKASDGGDMAGTPLTITDAQGNIVAQAAFGSELWPGTEGLHVLDIAVIAGAELGLQQWQLAAAASDIPPRLPAQASIRLNQVAVPDCTVEIIVMDTEGTSALRDAQVILHPYRARTDANGVATLQVPKGQYRLNVSKTKYEANTFPVLIDTDFSQSVRLTQEPVEDPDAHYI